MEQRSKLVNHYIAYDNLRSYAYSYVSGNGTGYPDPSG